MIADVLREEIHSMIDALPDRRLAALRPLLADLVEDYWKPIVEPASPEEAAMINERAKEYDSNPSSFVPRKKGV